MCSHKNWPKLKITVVQNFYPEIQRDQCEKSLIYLSPGIQPFYGQKGFSYEKTPLEGAYGLINREIQVTCFPIGQNVTFRDEFTGLREKPFRGVKTQITGIAEKGQSGVKFWSMWKVSVGRLKADGRDQARNFLNTRIVDFAKPFYVSQLVGILPRVLCSFKIRWINFPKMFSNKMIVRIFEFCFKFLFRDEYKAT